jgi:hypothetical protein
MNSLSTSTSSNDYYSFTLITQITNKNNNNNNNKQIDLDSTLNDVDEFICFDQEWYPINNNNNNNNNSTRM